MLILAEKSPYDEQMRTLRYRSLAGAAALSIATLGLAGCGSDDSTNRGVASQSTGSASSSTFATAQETSPAESRAEESTPSSAEAELTQENFLERTNGAMLKQKSYRSEMTIEGPGINETTVTDTVISLDPSKRVLQMTVPIDDSGTQATVIVLNGMAYMQFPDYAEGKWALLDGSDPELPTAEDFLAESDLLSVVAKSKNMSEAIVNFSSEPGAETIDGVSTTKLTLLLDAERYLGADAGPMIGDTVTATYFVGPDDLPRRITTQVGPGVVTMGMSRWGEPLDVKAPLGDEIIPLEKMMELIEQQG